MYFSLNIIQTYLKHIQTLSTSSRSWKRYIWTQYLNRGALGEHTKWELLYGRGVQFWAS